MNLTAKQKAFCEYYLANANATEAAKRAGYSDKTAYSQGQRMLKNVEIKKNIEKHTNVASSSRIATASEVLEYLTGVLRDEDIGTKDRTKAAELLGKRFALFEEQKERQVDDKMQISINIEDCGGTYHD